ncbi:hypothetical protein MKK69_08925 [Methylobacterium sp. J-026]|uniref:hypothetical protein n=1 Tax=Methylobacterium sp. J-026 TaxID=2836624 RepID=UPI001FB93CD6|nr:hypothetical protein [Methylobacterium sp. J-026]MCJ2134178.1 hypothetical protein [Methylobacterium sp. J-026]
MEHYRSTLAIAGVAAFGLVAAAHILHPGNYEDLPRGVQASVSRAEAPVRSVAWTSPPARADALSALSNAVVPVAQAAEIASPGTASLASRRAALSDPATPGRLSGIEATRRRRIAQRRFKVYQVALTQRLPANTAKDRRMAAHARPARSVEGFNPIRTLIHGLGLDG